MNNPVEALSIDSLSHDEWLGRVAAREGIQPEEARWLWTVANVTIAGMGDIFYDADEYESGCDRCPYCNEPHCLGDILYDDADEEKGKPDWCSMSPGKRMLTQATASVFAALLQVYLEARNVRMN